MTSPHVTALWIYPVKSCRGIPLDTVTLDALGPSADRRFLIIGPTDGKQITQRTHPALARIATALTDTRLQLACEPIGSIEVPRVAPEATPLLRAATVWSSTNLQSEDCGDEAAQFVSAVVGSAARLVRIGAAFQRHVKTTNDAVGFADGYPLLIANETSLRDLNEQLQERGEDPVPMTRFRPNVVIDHVPAFAEHVWPRVQIGSALFRSGGPCGRCIMTTQDQITGTRLGPEPLRTLATYRRDATTGAVNFGQNLINESKSGTIQIGDSVVPLP